MTSYKVGFVYMIYKLNEPDLRYIGSSITKKPADRWRGHKNKYKNYLEDKSSCISIYPYFKKYGIENFKFQVIKKYKIADKKGMLVYEQLYINKLKCINERNAIHFGNCIQFRQIRSQKRKEYQQKNKDKIKKREKQYRQVNKGKIKEYKKKYHQDNKDKIKEKRKEYYEDNKELLLREKKEYYEKNKELIKLKKAKHCDVCGKFYKNVHAHLKTKKHLKNLEQQ